MPKISDDEIRRILEDSDGKDAVMESLDLKEDQDEEDDEDGEAYLEVGPEIEESIEMIAREVQLGNNVSSIPLPMLDVLLSRIPLPKSRRQSNALIDANSENEESMELQVGNNAGGSSSLRAPDSPIQLPVLDIPSRVPAPTRRRQSNGPIDANLENEESMELKVGNSAGGSSSLRAPDCPIRLPVLDIPSRVPAPTRRRQSNGPIDANLENAESMELKVGNSAGGSSSLRAPASPIQLPVLDIPPRVPAPIRRRQSNGPIDANSENEESMESQVGNNNAGGSSSLRAPDCPIRLPVLDIPSRVPAPTRRRQSNGPIDANSENEESMESQVGNNNAGGSSSLRAPDCPIRLPVLDIPSRVPAPTRRRQSNGPIDANSENEESMELRVGNSAGGSSSHRVPASPIQLPVLDIPSRVPAPTRKQSNAPIDADFQWSNEVKEWGIFKEPIKKRKFTRWS